MSFYGTKNAAYGVAGLDINGFISIGNLPLGTNSSAGIVQADGATTTIADGIISVIGGGGYVLPPATTTTLGGLIVPTAGNLLVDGSGNITVPLTSSSVFGVAKVDGTTITSVGGVISATGGGGGVPSVNGITTAVTLASSDSSILITNNDPITGTINLQVSPTQIFNAISIYNEVAGGLPQPFAPIALAGGGYINGLDLSGTSSATDFTALSLSPIGGISATVGSNNVSFSVSMILFGSDNFSGSYAFNASCSVWATSPSTGIVTQFGSTVTLGTAVTITMDQFSPIALFPAISGTVTESNTQFTVIINGYSASVPTGVCLYQASVTSTIS